ncbi:hypothetical protein EVJ32_04560 [Exiguobacterium sp. SH5S4]|uniref:hypothetical protein n=1 Tax=Exiguobacterium sp. SH5S4 TaxID=2510961 RepID=UPI00103B9778|nr:hypothetical protein [Exiguobacterium sp. SH5S4]TCI26649.1 hypothetical protein EVJ32_04560 [Exiguobacterium sp. SH5S4]
MKLYVCKSLKQYQFLRSQKVYPLLAKIRTYDEDPKFDGRPASIFEVTEELSSALVEWSKQYGGAGRA